MRKAFKCGGFLKLDTFLPKRADVGMVEAKLDTGDCFMMIGRDEGRFRPWSLSLMSFMAMENSSRSIFPSLSMSARFLEEEKEEEEEEEERKTDVRR